MENPCTLIYGVGCFTLLLPGIELLPDIVGLAVAELPVEEGHSSGDKEQDSGQQVHGKVDACLGRWGLLGVGYIAKSRHDQDAAGGTNGRS